VFCNIILASGQHVVAFIKSQSNTFVLGPIHYMGRVKQLSKVFGGEWQENDEIAYCYSIN